MQVGSDSTREVQKPGRWVYSKVYLLWLHACERHQCKEGYIEERVLIFQLLEIIDKIDLDRSGIKKKLEAEIERYKKFHSGIMGKAEEEYRAKDADIRNYAKYLLTEGTMFEKRDLLTCLKSKISLKDKNIIL